MIETQNYHFVIFKSSGAVLKIIIRFILKIFIRNNYNFLERLDFETFTAVVCIRFVIIVILGDTSARFAFQPRLGLN